ncbi:MAG TPA: DUF192 domain-containing protein [Thermoleophilaceae bacterium]
MLPRRLERLPVTRTPGGLVLHEARGLRARLLGLALLRPGSLPPGHGLLIPRCSSVHTFGMRFAVDVLFLDRRGSVIRSERGVPPGRVLICRGAAAVVERATPRGAP